MLRIDCWCVEHPRVPHHYHRSFGRFSCWHRRRHGSSTDTHFTGGHLRGKFLFVCFCCDISPGVHWSLDGPTNCWLMLRWMLVTWPRWSFGGTTMSLTLWNQSMVQLRWSCREEKTGRCEFISFLWVSADAPHSFMWAKEWKPRTAFIISHVLQDHWWPWGDSLVV